MIFLDITDPIILIPRRKKISFIGNCFSKDRMAVLSRYEAAIEKSLYKALAELIRLQALRQGLQLNPQPVDIGFVSQKTENI